MEVVLVRWPSGEAERTDLAASGVPRLLLVENGEAPPAVGDDLEDWIRVPAGDADLHARIAGLERRLRSRGPGVPAIDDDGVLRVQGGWVPLPPVEARLTGAL
nr:helix-turn-helix domain-containing protein [Acidimicrobiia bacterium]